MTGRDRLLAALSPDIVAAIEELVAEGVREQLATLDGNGAGPLLSLDAAADYLGVSVRTLERLVAKDRIPTRTIGRRRLVLRSDLDAFAESGDAGGRSANHVHRAAATRTLDTRLSGA